MAVQVDFRIAPEDQFTLFDPSTKKNKTVTYFTLLAKIRGAVGGSAVGGGFSPSITDPSNNQLIVYNSQDDQWENRTVGIFNRLIVSGQTDVVASSLTNSLTFVGGTGVTIATNATTDTITINSTVGTVTSVDMSVPTGFAISGNPITSAGTLALGFDTGYSLPTDAIQATWTAAYDETITAATFDTANGVITLTKRDTNTITVDIDGRFIPLSQRAAANGVATLDGGGKIPTSQLPSSVFLYLGTWNASTNTPTLNDSSGTSGDVYRVSVAGTQNLGSGNISFEIGDLCIYDGSAWQKSDSTDAVTSVNGLTGTVVLDIDDINDVDISSIADGQYLTYQASTGNWVNTTQATADPASNVLIACKNTSGSTINKGTPVYKTGTVGATNVIEIAPAEAGDATKMPAVGLLTGDLVQNGTGYVIVTGELLNLITSPIDGSTPSINDTIYVKSSGGLTLTKPQGSTNLIQNMGLVGKVSTGNSGSLTVSSIMRSNDVPNLPTGKVWVGTATNTAASSFIHLDEANNRLGVNTSSPSKTLEVDGDISINTSSGNKGIRIITEATAEGYLIFGDADDNSMGGIAYNNNTNALSIDANNAERITILSSGDVGIGTNNPGSLLHIDGSRTSANLQVNQTGTGIIANFKQGGNSKIVIDNDGDLGIGTTLPSSKLHISGISQTGTSTVFRIENDTNNTKFLINSVSGDYNLQFKNAGNSVKVLLNSNGDSYLNGGNVGIGASNPQEKLEVAGNVKLTGSIMDIKLIESDTTDVNSLIRQQTGLFRIDTISDDENTITRRFTIDNSDGQVQLNSYGSGTHTGTAIKNLQVDSSGNIIETAPAGGGISGGGAATRVTFWSAASVLSSDSEFYWDNTNKRLGIGTDNPSSKLTVGGNGVTTLNPTAIITDTTNGGSLVLRGQSPILAFDKTSTGVPKILMDTGGLQFKTGTLDSEGDIDMVILSDGNVGIGTATPISLLEISKQLSAASTIDYPYTISSRDDGNTINQVGGEGVGIKFRIAGNDATTPGNSMVGASIAAIRELGSDSDSSTGLGFFVTQNDETLDEAVRINHDGKVGIGIDSPTANLEIQSATSSDAFVIKEGTNSSFKMEIDSSDNAVYNMYSNGEQSQVQISTAGDSYFNGGDVGIGNTNPTAKLQVSGSVQLDVMPTHESEGSIKIGRYDTNTSRFNLIKNFVSSTAASNYMKFSIHNGTANATVDVLSLSGNGNATFAGAINAANANLTGALNISNTLPTIKLTDTDNSAYARIRASNGGLLFEADEDNTQADSNIRFEIDASEKMRIDSAGNLGIGVVPKTGGSTWQHIQFGGTGNIIARKSDSTLDSMFANNYYINSSNVDSHIITGAATRMFLNDGEIRFDTAPSASADSAASFTNRMLISNAGAVKLSAYGGGTITGTAVKALAVDSSGNVIERNLGINGSGVATRVAFWDSTSSISSSANLYWDNTNNILELADDSKVALGAGNDLQIYHDATNSYVKTTSGNLIIQNELNDADIVFKAYNSAGSLATYFDIDGSAGVTKFRIDTRHLDNVKANFGQSNDLQIYHDTTNSFITNSTGDFTISNTGDDLILKSADDFLLYVQGSELAIQAVGNAGVILRHNNVAKFETTSTGVTVSGDITFGDSHFIGDDANDNLLIQSSANENIIINSLDDLYLRTSGTTQLTITATTSTFSNKVVITSGTAYPLQTSSSQRYGIQIRNTNNTVNSAYGWWLATDTNFNFALHADGASDKFTLTRDGNATFTGSVTATGAFQVPYAASQKKPMIVLSGATSYGLFHTEATSDIFSFDYGGVSKHSFYQSGDYTLAGAITLSGKISGVTAGTANTDAVNLQQLTDAVLGVLKYQGVWSASGTAGGSPDLTQAARQIPGYYWIVSVAGSAAPNGTGTTPNEWAVGDWCVFSDQATDAWQKIDNTNILAGAGTGGTISAWTGTGTSTTLGNSPLTFSGTALTASGGATFGGGLTIPDSILISYTGSDASGRDAGIKIVNDLSDWGIIIDKGNATGNNYGIRINTDGGNAFSLYNSSNVNKINFTGAGNATFAGNLTVSGSSSSLATGSSGTFVTNDSNNYPRITTDNSNAQLGLFRSGGSAGGMYIGANSSSFFLMNASFSTKFSVSQAGAGVFAGSVTASSAGTSTAPTLSLTNTASLNFNHSINAFAPNLTSGESNILVFGRAGSTKNSAYIGYRYSGTAGSNDNLLILGHWASDNLMTISGDGNVGIGTGTGKPSQKLQVEGNSWIKGIYYDTSGDAGSSGQVLSSTSSGTNWISPGGDSGFAEMIRFNRSGINSSTYTMIATVNGDNLASIIKMTMTGTSGSVVFACTFDITVNHSQDIHVNSTNGDYTEITLRITSNNNEDYSIEAKHNGSSTTTAEVCIFPLADETITPTTTDPGYTGAEYEHTATEGWRFGGEDNSAESSNVIVDDKIGIGTTTPDYELDVAGEIGLDSYLRHNGDTDTFFGFSGNDEIKFRTSGSDRIFINSSGNVGIGETSVDARLHITALASSGISNIKLESPGASKWAFGIPASQTYFALDDVNDNLTTPKVVVLKTSGNVGIGTTSPENLLHVQQSALYTGIQTTAGIRVKSSGASASGNYHGTIALSRGTGSAAISAVQDAADSDVVGLSFFTHPSTTGGDASVEKMRITSAGNVGIGETDPQQKLHVDGRGLFETGGSIPDSTTGTYEKGITLTGGNQRLVIDVSSATNGGSYIQTRHQSTSFPTAEYSLALNPLGGNVGIGNSNPLAKLVVGGGIHASTTGIDVSAGANGGNCIGLTTADNHNWLPYTNGNNYYSAGIHYFRAGTGNSPNYIEVNSSGIDILTGNIAVDSGKGWNNSGSWTRNQTPYGYIDIGPANTSHAHIYTDRPNFYFNKQLVVLGNTVWNSGNDGSGSGLDADLLDGVHKPTNFSATSQTYTTIATGQWDLPTGSSVFSKSDSVGGPGQIGYWYVTGRRDISGGYGGIYSSYSSGNHWFGYNTSGTSNPTWDKIWTDKTFTPGDYLPLAGGTMSGAINLGNNNITNLNVLSFDDGISLFGGGDDSYLHYKSNDVGAGGIEFFDGDDARQGYLYYDGDNNTPSFGLLDASGTWAVRILKDGLVELRYDNAIKLQTTSTGVTATGNVTATQTSGGNGTGVFIGGLGKATGSGITTQWGTNTMIYTGQISASQAGLFPATSNANSILTFNRHSGNYYNQLGFSSNGNMYYRSFNNVAINTTQAWSKVALETNGAYLPLAGGTMSGSIDFGISNAYVNLSKGSFITFYENGNAHHGIGSRNNSGGEADDIRINSYGAVYINLDSNSNNTSGADFSIGRHGGGTATISDLGFRVSGETGNVGVGTINPDRKLSVESTDSVVARFTNPSNQMLVDLECVGSAASNGFRFTEGGTFKMAMTYVPSIDGIQFGTSWVAGSEKMVIRENGRVGIATNNPSYPLHVNAAVSNVSIYASADIAAFSDARVKDNIIAISGAVDKIKAIRGVTYQRTDLDSEKRFMGVIAQEVLPHVPEVVHEDEKGMYSVSYQNMVALLIEGMKEQQDQIDELKEQIKKLSK